MVPNVPCGVERLARANFSSVSILFLMYRVELKELSLKKRQIPRTSFLMYRVELKVEEAAVIAAK